MSEKLPFKENSDDASAVQKLKGPMCPICNLRIDEGVCEKHGTICDTCGTLFKDPFCPNCHSHLPEESVRGKQANPETLRLGELGIAPRGFSAITGRESVSKKEINILNAASAEDPSRKKMRQKAEAAIRWLNVPRNTETGLLEAVEINAVSLANRSRREAGRSTRVSLEKVVAYSLLTEARKIGRTILEVQEALAKAGFNIKLQLFTLRISIPHNADVSSVILFVNDWKRSPESFKPKEAGYGPLGKEYMVSVQALLSDTIDRKGRIGKQSWMKVRFENALIIPDASAIFNHSDQCRSSWYSIPRANKTKGGKDRVKFLQRDPSNVWIQLNAEKCFALFKDMNLWLENTSKVNKDDNFGSSNSVDVEVESSIRQHLPLPSKKFPATAALMQRALCLSKFERRSIELFRQFLKNSEGRSQRTLATEALLRADKEVYSSLPQSTKYVMKGYVSTLPLKRMDKSYTGVEGLLIPSELTWR